jgi:hypothetical protein
MQCRDWDEKDGVAYLEENENFHDENIQEVS